jgi:uncharacterized membrane protein HdeD (DUF308 family)
MSLDPTIDRSKLPPASAWLLFVVLGVVWMVLGLLAIGEPHVATNIAVLFLGGLLTLGGVLHIVHAFVSRRWYGFLFRLLEGVLCLLIGGLLLIDNPKIGEMLLTVLLTVILILGGVFRIVLGLQLRQMGNWFVLLLGGVIEVLLGLMIVGGWPQTSEWVIGLFIGIRMLFNGSSMLALGLALRSLPGEG